jgi:GNAT superfamily N-acetyltransferase
MLTFAQALQEPDLREVRALFIEHAEALGMGRDDMDRELASLPGEYTPPRGGLILARWDGEAAGCVGFRPVKGGIAELKRLHVRPAYRGKHIGRALAEEVLMRARLAGYARLRVDSLPSMTVAQQMYRALGLTQVPSYRFNPGLHTVYVEVELGGPAPATG